MPESKQSAVGQVPGREEISSGIADQFSLIEGGPIYRVQSWLGVAMPDHRHVIIQAVLLAAITWLPLLILATLQGEAIGNVKIPFLRDFAVNVRFLIALPVLVMAEIPIDPRVKHAARHFVESGLVSRQHLSAFESVIVKTLRLRDAVLPSVLLVIFAYAPSVWSWGGELVAPEASSWHMLAAPAGNALSLAGLWFAFVSVPLYRLVYYRWLWLILLWTIFLARIAGLRLGWIPTHPDKAAGLGFLAHTQHFFAWIGFAASASVAAKFANMITYQGATVSGLKFQMIVSSVLLIVVVAAPLLVLSYRLFKIKERGLSDYGTLGTRYVQEFDAKWNQRQLPGSPLGTPDLQSLADLSNSFAVIDGMRMTLLSRETLLWLAVPVILPMLVLSAVETPVEELVKAVLKLMG